MHSFMQILVKEDRYIKICKHISHQDIPVLPSSMVEHIHDQTIYQ